MLFSLNQPFNVLQETLGKMGEAKSLWYSLCSDLLQFSC